MKPLLCSTLLLLTFSLNAQARVAVPIPKEPHHHLVFENSYVRVFRVSVHSATLLHQHDVPYLYVALGPAEVINAVQGNPEVHLVMADGQLGYSRGGFAHIARTDAGLVFNNVTIELVKPKVSRKTFVHKSWLVPPRATVRSHARRPEDCTRSRCWRPEIHLWILLRLTHL